MNLKTAKFELGIQKDIRDEKTGITGSFKKEFNSLQDKSLNLAEELRETEEGKINEAAILEKAKDLDIEKEDIEEAFKTGLRYNIKASYKIGLLDKNSSDNDIKAIIGAYSLSFRSSLNSFNREKEKGKNATPGTIVNIIKKMYILPPKIMSELREKYKDHPDVDERIIKYFAVGNPVDPEKAIEGAIKTISELREKYKDHPDVSEGMIKHFAVGNPVNPEKAIEGAIKIISELREKYKDHPDVERWMIKHCAVHHPVNPEKAIERAIKTISELREKYKDHPDINERMIKQLAVYNPVDPEKAIEKAIKTISELREKYKDHPDVDEWMIKRFTVSNSSDPEKAIEKALEKKK